MTTLLEMKVDEEEFESLLDRLDVEARSDWEQYLAEDLRQKFNEHGLYLPCSAGVLEILRRIAKR